MAKFKVGDRVRFTNKHGPWSDHRENNGKIGTIYRIYNHNSDISVGFDNNHSSTFIRADELEYPKVKDTKIARLVHKNSIREIKDGFIWLR